MILIIDNFDSFVHNLARYLRQLGQETLVLRNDDQRLQSIELLQPSAILISPGPKTPRESGFCTEVIQKHFQNLPMIGVCLGHQAIVAAMGGNIIRAIEPMHGRTSSVQHNGHPMFDEIETTFSVCRYHSLIAERHSFPGQLQITAECENGEIMAFAHRDLPIFGIQFHPEAVLTEHGYQLLSNVLNLCGIECRDETVAHLQATVRCEDRLA